MVKSRLCGCIVRYCLQWKLPLILSIYNRNKRFREIANAIPLMQYLYIHIVFEKYREKTECNITSNTDI
jgi:hypothetical protein